MRQKKSLSAYSLTARRPADNGNVGRLCTRRLPQAALVLVSDVVAAAHGATVVVVVDVVANGVAGAERLPLCARYSNHAAGAMVAPEVQARV